MEFFLLNLLLTLDVVKVKVVAIAQYKLIDLKCLVIIFASFSTTKVKGFGMFFFSTKQYEPCHCQTALFLRLVRNCNCFRFPRHHAPELILVNNFITCLLYDVLYRIKCSVECH